MTKLWIVTDVNKLPSMLVFKGEPDSRVERRLHRNSFVKSIKIFTYCQLKGWNNMTIMKSGSMRFGGSTLILY